MIRNNSSKFIKKNSFRLKPFMVMHESFAR